MSNETGHSILCAWPYRDCQGFCEHLTEWDSRKFTAPLAERLWTLTLDSNQDADLGDADTFGWWARFDGPRALICADAQGFVSVSLFGSLTGLEAAWTDLERKYAWSALRELDTSECDELFLMLDTAEHNGTMPDMEAIEEHIRTHEACFARNAWALETL